MTAKIRFTLLLVGGLFICLGVYFFLFKPVLNQLSAQSEVLRQKNVEVATMRQQIIAYKSAQTDLSKAVEKDRILNALLQREELVSAIKNLEKAASVTKTSETLKINEPGAEQDNLPDPVVEAGGYLGEIPYRVSTINDFLGTVQFLRYLEHLPQFTEIAQINLSAETVDSDTQGRIYTGKVFGTIDGVFFVKTSP
ncbi:MAG: hypothetical protein HY395_01895 [Candidatus Doudnabacteria bacterium]|nr:hypothetical protein [Candidatus Doudnabacteria bacterium]